jgi:hypothetical protein
MLAMRAWISICALQCRRSSSIILQRGRYCSPLQGIHCLERSELQIDNIPIHPVPLHQSKQSESPFCYAVSAFEALSSTESLLQSPSVNFLATQVWPSARVAALLLEQLISATCCDGIKNDDLFDDVTICELGCGPGLPILSAAVTAKKSILSESRLSKRRLLFVATDLDSFALRLVAKAAVNQGFNVVQQCSDTDIRLSLVESKTYIEFMIQQYDLLSLENSAKNVFNESSIATNEISDSILPPRANLYILSDVFESKKVAVGAAYVTMALLHRDPLARVWVFAQTDRPQREVFRECLESFDDNQFRNDISWRTIPNISPDCNSDAFLKWAHNLPRLFLFDVDETRVQYS